MRKTNFYEVSFLFFVAIYSIYLSYKLSHSNAFFDWDEWSLLANLDANEVLPWLIQPHLGHVFPVGKLFYLFEINIFSGKYHFYILTNILLQAISSILLFFLIKKIKVNDIVACILTIMYLLQPSHMENLVWGMQSALLLGVVLLLISFHLTWKISFGSSSRRTWLSLTLTMIASAFCFGFSLLIPIYCLAIYLIFNQKLNCIFIIFCLSIQILILILYFYIPVILDYSSVHPGAATSIKGSVDLSANGMFIIIQYIFEGYFRSIMNFIIGYNSDKEVIYALFTILLILVLSLFFHGNNNFKNKDITNIFISSVLILCAMIALLSLTRSYSIFTIYQQRYYHYLGVPIALILAFTLHGVLLPNYKIVMLSLFSIFVSANMIYETNKMLQPDWFRHSRGAIVRQMFNDLKITQHDGSSALFFRATSPELTKIQAQSIKQNLFSE